MVVNKKDGKENIAQGLAAKKDKKASSDVKVKQTAGKTKASAPPIIVIEDSDEEDEDLQGMSKARRYDVIPSDTLAATVEPPRRAKTVAMQPRRSPRLAGLPPEMAGLGTLLYGNRVSPKLTLSFLDEPIAMRRVRRTKTDTLEAM